MTIKKAVIPAAGLGTRFLPVTKSMPKEMLPIIDVPVIHYVVQEALASGIDDIIIITGRSKRAIEDYFDDSPELEMHLAKNPKNKELLSMVRDISSLADIHYVRQKEPLGLGDAVLRAGKHISGEPFAVLLGDDIIKNTTPCTRQLIDTYNRYRCSVLAVETVPDDMVSRYGIIKGKLLEDSLSLLEDIVEKPKLEDAPSRMGAIGRYVFTPEIFDCLHTTERGVGGEIQLTDAIRLLNGRQNIYAYEFSGRRYDTGDRMGYLEAIIDVALEQDDLREELMEYMRGVVRTRIE
ncbi:MAG: UDP-glucose pyrophosphorylase [Methanomicrobiales archaeon 53_19]|uniref:UTP--glucose-1-phosphate uridylyltransferase GalU n=1 Tax=Methanocalculus sp. TaxID=2004547 RepID=UPI000748BD65|nr:UTP--glucose-1-phosphate uridylyltransferase GalU [Methanocalculus sp.]KUK68990.1 MAG: UDP-glucose pyrophosphorylase [Methanocalculus sp. 52_23]KUL04359.1 MAG: UDP-glucose pyrophosphorylase [Methanomicrobiales archaeon 53_19]HIJ07200.1 UTP--glucose-1-phosphate uridylyltransferase GalU [Methanocalculus sp.]